MEECSTFKLYNILDLFDQKNVTGYFQWSIWWIWQEGTIDDKFLCGTRHVWIGEKGKMIKNQLKRFTNYGDKK